MLRHDPVADGFSVVIFNLLYACACDGWDGDAAEALDDFLCRGVQGFVECVVFSGVDVPRVLVDCSVGEFGVDGVDYGLWVRHADADDGAVLQEAAELFTRCLFQSGLLLRHQILANVLEFGDSYDSLSSHDG